MSNTKCKIVSMIQDINRDEKKKTNLLFFILFLLLFGFGAYSFIFKKDEPQPQGERYCLVDGVKYNVGDEFTIDCNTCVCTATGQSCTFNICGINCVDSDSQCKDQDEGSICTLGIWCDQEGKICGGETCEGMGLGICIKGKCVGE